MPLPRGTPPPSGASHGTRGAGKIKIPRSQPTSAGLTQNPELVRIGQLLYRVSRPECQRKRGKTHSTSTPKKGKLYYKQAKE